MKKYIYIIAVFMLSGIAAVAQPCVPDPSLKSPGLIPSQLPDGSPGVAYNQVITLMVPLDSTVNFNGTIYNIRIDSATVVSLDHIPPGYNYETDKPSKTWNGGQKGCARLYGTTTATYVGTYVIQVKVLSYFKIVGLSNQFTELDSSSISFRIAPTGLLENHGAIAIPVYPNPVQSKLYIPVEKAGNNLQISVYNMVGQQLDLPVTTEYQSTLYSFNTEMLKPGFYVLKVKDGDKLYQSRFVKE